MGKVQYTGLVGDVGGTNARFAVVDAQGHIRNPRIFPAKEYPGIAQVIDEYLETTCGRWRPAKAVIAVAGPVVDGEIEFTNLEWQVSEGDLVAHFEFEAVKLINDFAAQALAAPRLRPEELRPIGPAIRAAGDCPMLVLGAGTGFGVAGLARGDRGDIAVATEGGHAHFAPTDDLEVQILEHFRKLHDRVSVERILSGPGIFELYRAMASIQGQRVTAEDEKAVVEAAARKDPLAEAALDRFCAIMGSVAGDIALTFGARGGVFVSGGIAPKIADRLVASDFRRRFEAKGRLSGYMQQIPTSLVLHPYPAIAGAARELEQMERL